MNARVVERGGRPDTQGAWLPLIGGLRSLCGEPAGKQEWAAERNLREAPLPRKKEGCTGRRLSSRGLRMGAGEGPCSRAHSSAAARAARRRGAISLMHPCARVSLAQNSGRFWSLVCLCCLSGPLLMTGTHGSQSSGGGSLLLFSHLGVTC